MLVALEDGVFIRSAGSESIVWSPVRDTCLVVVNAHPFLEALSRTPMSLDRIISIIAEKYGCSIGAVREDALTLFGKLASLELVECSGECNQFLARQDGEVGLAEEKKSHVGYSYSDFCLKHHLISELHIDLTDCCNERCVHCYIPKGGRKFLEEDCALKVMREFRQMEGGTVIFSGGECMLHPSFCSIVNTAYELGLNVGILSNLTVCSDQIVSVLKTVKPQFVSVSLYSMNEHEHDAITTVPGSWKRTLSAILKLHQSGVVVRVATPILKLNQSAVGGVAGFCEKLDIAHSIDIDIIGCMDHTDRNRLYALEGESLKSIVRENMQELCPIRMSPNRSACDARVCEIGDLSLNINAHGDYYPCDGFHGLVLGNANDMTLGEVWTSDRLNRLRNLRNVDFGECADCDKRQWCKVCAMRNFNETGDMYLHASFRCKMAEMFRSLRKGE